MCTGSSEPSQSALLDYVSESQLCPRNWNICLGVTGDLVISQLSVRNPQRSRASLCREADRTQTLLEVLESEKAMCFL